MRSRPILFILFVVLAGSSFLVNYFDTKKTANLSEEQFIEKTLKDLGFPPYANANPIFQPVAGEIYLPIKNFYKNQTVNPFGVYRTGRFVGYHTGVDIEIDPADLEKDVPVYAISSGEVIVAEEASGYGGVVAIRHSFEGNKNVIGIYGHLRLRDIKATSGQKITSGYLIGYLGAAYTSETGVERKHLHFGLYKDSNVNIKGYADTKAELAEWFDPNDFMRQAGIKVVN